jgi:glycosyltransferase involved in cell wall biosynthesis
MKKIKVMHYYSYSTQIGGPLTYINNILNSRLLNYYEFETCYQQKAPKGINIPLLLKMRDNIRIYQPDILHVHGLQSEGLYGLLAGRLAKCRRILITVHGLASDTIQMNGIKRVLYKYLVEPVTLRQADYVYCVCEYATTRSIIKRNATRLWHTIYSGVSIQQPVKKKEDIRNEIKIPTSKVMGITVGRIVKDKGLLELSDTIKSFYKYNEDRLRFCIVGDGDYKEELSHKLSEEVNAGYVIFCGYRDDIAELLSAADFFLLPSWHENFSLSLLEASQIGLPCIATNVGGNPEIVIDNETGILIPPHQSDSISVAITYILNYPNQALIMGNKAKERVNHLFTTELMINNIDESTAKTTGQNLS